MDSRDTSIAEKIILATIDLIGQNGIPAVTVRKIAAKANVNGAAINYYFGTKEKLIDRALQQSLDEMSKLPDEFLDLENKTQKERLQLFLSAMLEGIHNYPGITQAHLYAPLYQNDMDSKFIAQFDEYLNKIFLKISRWDLEIDNADLKLVIVEVVSAVIMPTVLPQMFKAFAQLDFSEEEIKNNYIEKLIERFGL